MNSQSQYMDNENEQSNAAPHTDAVNPDMTNTAESAGEAGWASGQAAASSEAGWSSNEAGWTSGDAGRASGEAGWSSNDVGWSQGPAASSSEAGWTSSEAGWASGEAGFQPAADNFAYQAEENSAHQAAEAHQSQTAENYQAQAAEVHKTQAAENYTYQAAANPAAATENYAHQAAEAYNSQAADNNTRYAPEPNPNPAAENFVHPNMDGFIPLSANGPVQSREEWERQQREIQDREWQSRQFMYNRQLAEQRVAPPDRQNGFVPAQNQSGPPYDGYPPQYEPQVFSGDGAWQSNERQYSQPRQQPYYPRQQAGANQQYQQNPYYYGARQPQASPPQQQDRQDEKTGKRKTRLRVIAALLAGAMLITVIFTAGYYAGNYGFGFRLSEKSPVQAASAADQNASSESTTQSNVASGWANSGGLFGNRQDRPSVLPPEDQQDQNAGGIGGDQQPDQQQQQQPDQQQQQPDQQQQQQQPAQAAIGSAGAISSLTLNPPRETELTIPEIYQKVYPSIVGIRITFQSQAYRFGGIQMPGQEQSGEGSGIIISDNGYIMTNHHVVSEVIDLNTRNQIDGTKIDVFLPDDSTTAYPATIVGYDQSTDLCVLKIDKTDLKEAELGDADSLVVGEFVVAIGNPGGMEYMSSVTFGVISGLNRSIQTEGYRDIQLIQTDAAINPGNSGGALINKSGQVIGVNSIKIAASAFEGLGFAIPINAAVAICEDLMNYTYVTGRPYIGITAYSQYTEQLANQYNMPKGVYVYEVDESGPAVSIIKKNDIIVKFNSVEITNFDTLEKEKNTYKPGDKVTIQVYRDWSTNDYTSGKYVDVEIVLGEKRN